MYLSDIYTIYVNLARLPGLSMLCGFDSGEFPVGTRIIGPVLSELAVLDVSHAFQQEIDYHPRPVKGLSDFPALPSRCPEQSGIHPSAEQTEMTEKTPVRCRRDFSLPLWRRDTHLSEGPGCLL